MKPAKIARSQPQHTGKSTDAPRRTPVAKWLNQFSRHPLFRTGCVVILFVGLWLFVSYLWFRRFPNNYLEPNFFGEEGYVFSNNIIHHGFWHAFLTTFNGYYIWGLYLLEEVAFALNSILSGGQFANLPRVFSLVSYGFLGLMVLLPTILLRRYIKLPVLLLTSLLVLYVPMRGWDYGIIGALGDLKFAFVWIAFLLLIYRHYLPSRSKKFYLVDFVLLVCAYTNVTVYPMLLFGLIRYWPQVRGRQFMKNCRSVFLYDRSLQSFLILGVLLLPQLYIVHRDGIPAMPGYLDQPYNAKRTVEIFVARSYLYELLFTIYNHLNDLITLIVAIGFIGVGLRFVGKYRHVFIFGLASIFLATFLFVVKRTGVSVFFIGYHDPGPDQFFFTQNWIFGFLFCLLLVELISKLHAKLLQTGIYLLFAIGFLVFMAPQAGTYGKNNFEELTVGNIYAEGLKDCATPAQTFTLKIYPTPDVHYTGVTRQQLCTPIVRDYQPEIVSLGLKPAGGDYVMLGSTPRFTQTFVSTANNLNGLIIYFSTFTRTVNSPYKLTLFHSNCRRPLRTVQLDLSDFTDNSLETIQFPTIKNSANQTYCFTVQATRVPEDPLAVQLSAPNQYPAGKTTITGKNSDRTVVFDLHYK